MLRFELLKLLTLLSHSKYNVTDTVSLQVTAPKVTAAIFTAYEHNYYSVIISTNCVSSQGGRPHTHTYQRLPGTQSQQNQIRQTGNSVNWQCQLPANDH